MKTKFFPRFISMCLAASITLSFGTAIPTSAENIDTELDYYISLDANSDEYQEWKAAYSSEISANTISTFDLRGSANGISNEYIEITLNGNRYTLGTTGGNPDSAADNNQKLLYGYPGGGTSYTTVQIDGVNNIFTPQTTTFRDNSIISTAVIGDVVVTQYLNIIHNQYTGRDDVAEFFYTAENTGDNAREIGIRIMFDTMLGRNDSAPFRLPTIGDVTTETDLRGSDVPEFWQAFDSLTSPSVIAQGTLNIDKDSTPDRVRFTNWGTASGNSWDYVRSAGSSNGDSAVCLYWNPRTIGTNETLSCKTYYGLSSLQQDNVPPLAVAISGATKLEVIEDENGKQSYSPNPFTVTAYIQNVGTGTAYNTNVELVLPEGMSVVNGSEIVSLGDVAVSNRQTQVSWKVEVEPSAIDRVETYGVIVSADNAETKTLEREIEIPAITNSGVELLLDRSAIYDGSNLNLKFKIINTGESAVSLDQIHPRYYFIDESPNTEKNLSCYYVQLDKPYSYVPNTAVTMTVHNLENLCVNATSYFEFEFDSDEQLQPNQEIIINSSINNTSWSKIVASNDYSAVGDDSLAENGYVAWEYMPVFSATNSDEPIWGIAPEIDTDGMEPDLLVELDPNAVNGKGYMNLNIRITNNGLLPIDLGQTEIKYYYTNDKGLPQSVAGNYIGGRIDNNYVGITDKSLVEAVKMDVRKNMADTYVSIKFAEDTGVLYFEDYIDLNVQVYNTDWKSGDYILENDHSYQEDDQELQTFSAMARAASNTTGMREAKKIVVGTRYKTSWLEDWFYGLFGYEPIKYEPTYSAFKTGEGSKTGYTTADYDCFIDIFEDAFGGNQYNEYACAENINNDISFEYENLKAILESDIVYISGHGFDGGVIPIYQKAQSHGGIGVGVNNYDIILSTDKNIGRDFHRYKGPEISEENIFSLNMKDHNSDEINENLKWIITAACSQLSDTTSFKDQEDITTSSVQRWINVLANNDSLKGVIGYHGTAPGARDDWFVTDKAVIDDFLTFSAYGYNGHMSDIYASWLNANTAFDTYRKKNAGLLVKAGCERELLYSSLCDNSDVEYSSIYLYKFSSGIGDWTTIKEEYKMSGSHGGGGNSRAIAFAAVENYIDEINLPINDDTQVISAEITRDIYEYNGEYVESEIVDYIFNFKVETPSTQTFALNNDSKESSVSTIKLKFNVETSAIEFME